MGKQLTPFGKQLIKIKELPSLIININSNENKNENCSQKLSTQTLSATVRVIQKDDSQKKTRELYGPNEHCYVMDAKSTGNIGRYLNVRKLSRNN